MVKLYLENFEIQIFTEIVLPVKSPIHDSHLQALNHFLRVDKHIQLGHWHF